jgi:hypothetical protein
MLGLSIIIAALGLPIWAIRHELRRIADALTQRKDEMR